MATKTVKSGISEERYHPPIDSVVSNVGIATGVQATVSVAAGAAGVRNVLTGFSFNTSAITSLAISTVGCNVIDGATGGTTLLHRGVLTITSVGSQALSMSSLSVAGTAATAMTIEFSAGVTGLSEAVTMYYHTIGPN